MDCPSVVISPSKPCLIWQSSCRVYCSMLPLACAINSDYKLQIQFVSTQRIMWFWLILIAALLAFLAYLYGVFTPVTLYKDKLIAPHLFYFTFKGERSLISKQFDKIKKDTSEHFSLATCFGIYYTKPQKPVWECVLGFEVNAGQYSKVAGFVQEHPQYKESKLKSTRYVGSMLTYINYLSFILNISKIQQFFRLVEEEKIELFKGLIERYHFLPFFGKRVELVNPIDNVDQWNLLE